MDENTTKDRTWVDVQKKTFMRWANQFLSERMIKMEDLQEDLKDGVALCELLEIISSKSLGKINKQPKMRYHQLENCSRAVNFIKSEGLTLVGIGPEDIVDGKLKLDLGLIWTLILRYQINIIGTFLRDVII
jgi:filamin